jgi:hypothetical protein
MPGCWQYTNKPTAGGAGQIGAEMETEALKVHSGKSCLCDVGVKIGHQDYSGVDLHTGDIVIVWHGNWIGTDNEFWDACDGLTVVVMDQYQSFTDGSVKRQDGPNAPFVMGIRGCGFDDPEWRVRVVKKFFDVVPGEHWPAYGFSYRTNVAAEQAGMVPA